MKPSKSHRKTPNLTAEQREIAEKIAAKVSVQQVERNRRRRNGEPVRSRAAA